MVYLSVSENVLFVDLPEPTVKRDTFIEMLNDKDSLKLDRYPFSAYREQPQACPPPALRASNTLFARTHAVASVADDRIGDGSVHTRAGDRAVRLSRPYAQHRRRRCGPGAHHLGPHHEEERAARVRRKHPAGAAAQPSAAAGIASLFPVGEARSRSLLLRQRPLPKAVACRCITKLARQMRRRQSAQSLRMRTSRSRRRDHRPRPCVLVGRFGATQQACCGSARCRLCSCASSWRSQRSSSPTTRRSSSSPLLSPCPTPPPRRQTHQRRTVAFVPDWRVMCMRAPRGRLLPGTTSSHKCQRTLSRRSQPGEIKTTTTRASARTARTAAALCHSAPFCAAPTAR